MKFDGTNVYLKSREDGFSIYLRKDGKDVVELNMNEEESAKLLSFLITAFGLSEAIGFEEAEGFEPVGKEPVDNKRTTH
jgi:hypothetical protein